MLSDVNVDSPYLKPQLLSPLPLSAQSFSAWALGCHTSFLASSARAGFGPAGSMGLAFKAFGFKGIGLGFKGLGFRV